MMGLCKLRGCPKITSRFSRSGNSGRTQGSPLPDYNGVTKNGSGSQTGVWEPAENEIVPFRIVYGGLCPPCRYNTFSFNFIVCQNREVISGKLLRGTLLN